jgi:hypothetical protein
MFGGAEKSGKTVMVAAIVVDHKMWSSTKAPPLNMSRERFQPKRPGLKRAEMAQLSGPVHLRLGRDNESALPNVVKKSNLPRDNL